MSADEWSALTCGSQERSIFHARQPSSQALEERRLGVARAGPQVEGARVRLRQSARSGLHSRRSVQAPRRNSSCD